MHLVDQRDRRPWQRRVGAHAAGVRALVVVRHALEVLRREQRDDGGAVGDGEQRNLGAVEVFLDDDAGAGGRVRERRRRGRW